MGKTKRKPPLKKPPTEFFKQAKKSDNGLSKIRKWVSRCGEYAISEIDSRFESKRYLVIEIADNGSEGIINRNKTLRAAVEFWEVTVKKAKV